MQTNSQGEGPRPPGTSFLSLKDELDRHVDQAAATEDDGDRGAVMEEFAHRVRDGIAAGHYSAEDAARIDRRGRALVDLKRAHRLAGEDPDKALALLADPAALPHIDTSARGALSAMAVDARPAAQARRGIAGLIGHIAEPTESSRSMLAPGYSGAVDKAEARHRAERAAANAALGRVEDALAGHAPPLSPEVPDDRAAVERHFATARTELASLTPARRRQVVEHYSEATGIVPQAVFDDLAAIAASAEPDRQAVARETLARFVALDPTGWGKWSGQELVPAPAAPETKVALSSETQDEMEAASHGGFPVPRPHHVIQSIGPGGLPPVTDDPGAILHRIVPSFGASFGLSTKAAAPLARPAISAQPATSARPAVPPAPILVPGAVEPSPGKPVAQPILMPGAVAAKPAAASPGTQQAVTDYLDIGRDMQTKVERLAPGQFDFWRPHRDPEAPDAEISESRKREIVRDAIVRAFDIVGYKAPNPVRYTEKNRADYRGLRQTVTDTNTVIRSCIEAAENTFPKWLDYLNSTGGEFHVAGGSQNGLGRLYLKETSRRANGTYKRPDIIFRTACGNVNIDINTVTENSRQKPTSDEQAALDFLANNFRDNVVKGVGKRRRNETDEEFKARADAMCEEVMNLAVGECGDLLNESFEETE